MNVRCLTFESVMSFEMWHCVILINTCQQFGMTCCICLQGCSRYSFLTTGLSTHTHLPWPYHTHLPWPYHTHLPWPYRVAKPNAGSREVKEATEIQGDRKVSEHLMITIITTHVFLASLLGSIWLLGKWQDAVHESCMKWGSGVRVYWPFSMVTEPRQMCSSEGCSVLMLCTETHLFGISTWNYVVSYLRRVKPNAFWIEKFSLLSFVDVSIHY
jgi:hypothetical protein